MGNMAKTRKAYRIAQNRKVEFTKPSDDFAAILEGWGYHGQYLREWRLADLKLFGYRVSDNVAYFNADFILQTGPMLLHQMILEVDGPVHNSEIQMRKSVWRDEQLITAGFTVIHIPVDMLLPICKEVLEKEVHQRIERGESLSLKEALQLV